MNVRREATLESSEIYVGITIKSKKGDKWGPYEKVVREYEA